MSLTAEFSNFNDVDSSFSENHAMITNMVRDFAEKNIRPHVMEWDEAQEFPIETMKKLGVERRLLTAGSNKAMLDPFSPVNPKHEAYAQNMLNQIHEQFKTVVREGRGKRLIEDDQTFSGLFWSGEQSIKIGLADALGSADFVAREVIKQEDIVDFTYQETITDRFAKRLGASIVKSIGIDAITKGIQLK